MRHLRRAGFAALIGFLAVIADRASGQKLPAGAMVAILTVLCGALGPLTGEDRAHVWAFTPLALVAAMFTWFAVSEENINSPDLFAHVFFIVCAIGSVFFVSPVVGLASAVFTRNAPNRGSVLAAAVTTLVLAALFALAAMTAWRRPTLRAYVSSLPIAARLPTPPMPDLAEADKGWSSIVGEQEAMCGDLRVRRVRFAYKAECGLGPGDRVRQEVRGEPGDYGPLRDYCGPAIVHCDAAHGSAIVELPGFTIVVHPHDQREFVSDDIIRSCAPPHVWLATGALGLLVAMIALVMGRFRRDEAASYAGIAALAALVTSSPLVIAALLGRMHLSGAPW